MWKLRFKTSERLMLLASLLPFFYLVAFAPSVPVGKGSATCWQVLVALYGGPGGDHALSIFGLVLFWLAVFAVPSLIIGWAAQAIIVVLISSIRRGDTEHQTTTDLAV